MIANPVPSEALLELGGRTDEAAATSTVPDVGGHIRNLIVTRRLRAGEPVRADAVAQELSVSATPVREALRSLQAEGFLEYQRNRGFVVARLDAADIRDVFISIGLLAGELAARAATTAHQEDLLPMKSVLERLRQFGPEAEPGDITELLGQFYAQLHVLGHSPKMVSLILTLDKYTPAGIYSSTPGWLSRTVLYIELLIAAIQAHEPDAARAAIIGHMREAATLVSAPFESASDSAAVL